MALDRKIQKIFGKNADGNDLVIVGSKNAGNAQTSTDVATIQSLSNWETGLRAQVTSSDAPYLQDQNSIFYVITSQLAYLFQAGIAEWNAQTEYFSGRSVVLKDGKIYIAIANSVGIEPEVTSGWSGYWKNLSDWGFLGGNIYNQTDLWNALLKGLEYDSSVATAIGGYPKGTRLLYTQEDGTKIYIDSTKDNNTTVPSSSTIFYPKIYSGTSIVTILEIAQTVSDITITPTSSLANDNAFVLVLSSNYIYHVELTMGEYKWIPAQNATSIRPSAGRCFFDLDTKEYYGYDDNGNFKTMGELFAWITEQRKDESIKLISKGTNSGVNYRIWSDGYIEQEGSIGGSSSGNTIDLSVTLPYEMANTSYTITMSPPIVTSGTLTSFYIDPNNYSATGFTVTVKMVSGGGQVSIKYRISGYKK